MAGQRNVQFGNSIRRLGSVMYTISIPKQDFHLVSDSHMGCMKDGNTIHADNRTPLQSSMVIP